MLCVAVMLSVMVLGAGAAFSDQDQIENTEAVDACSALNIIGGYEDGSFHPERNIKRSEITKMICVALNGGKDPNVGTNETPTFTDVRGTADAWAEGYIEACVAQGIVSGVGGGRFAPAGNVTGAQLAKMLLVALGYDAGIENFTGNAWETNVNVRASQKHLYDGLEDLDTSVAVTRDQAAQMVWNAMQAYEVEYKTTIITDENGNLITQNVAVDKVVESNRDKISLLTDKYKAYINVGTLTTIDGKSMDILMSDSDKVDSDIPETDHFLDLKTDYSDLLGQKVKVMFTKQNNVMGVYATNENTVVTANQNAIDVDAGKIVIGDNSYAIDTDGVVVVKDGQQQANNWKAGNFKNAQSADVISLIDTDQDSKIDTAYIKTVDVQKVTYVSASQIIAGSKTYKFADDTIPEGVAKDDWVIITKDLYNDNNLLTVADKATGAVEATKKASAGYNQYQIDGTWYNEAPTNSGKDINTNVKPGVNAEYVAVNGILFYAAKTSAGADQLTDVLFVAYVGQDGLTNDQAKVMFPNGDKATITLKNAYSTTQAGAKGDTIVPGQFYEYSKSGNTYELIDLSTDADFYGNFTYEDKLDLNVTAETVGSDKIADTADVIVWTSNESGTTVDYKHITGKQLKALVPDTLKVDGSDNNLNATTLGYFTSDVDGLNRASVIAVEYNGSGTLGTAFDNISSNANYGFITKDAVKLANGKIKFTVWTGKENLEVIAEKSNEKQFTAGTIVGYTAIEEQSDVSAKADGTTYVMTDAVALTAEKGLVTAGSITGVNSAGTKIEASTINLPSSDLSDYSTVLYVDSKAGTGLTDGKAVKANSQKVNGTTYYATNLLVYGTEVIVIDVNEIAGSTYNTITLPTLSNVAGVSDVQWLNTRTNDTDEGAAYAGAVMQLSFYAKSAGELTLTNVADIESNDNDGMIVLKYAAGYNKFDSLIITGKGDVIVNGDAPEVDDKAITSVTVTMPALNEGDELPEAKSETANVTAATKWDPTGNVVAGQTYTATVTLTAADGYKFTKDTAVTAGDNGTVTAPTADTKTITVTYTIKVDDEGSVTPIDPAYTVKVTGTQAPYSMAVSFNYTGEDLDTTDAGFLGALNQGLIDAGVTDKTIAAVREVGGKTVAIDENGAVIANLTLTAKYAVTYNGETKYVAAGETIAFVAANGTVLVANDEAGTYASLGGYTNAWAADGFNKVTIDGDNVSDNMTLVQGYKLVKGFHMASTFKYQIGTGTETSVTLSGTDYYFPMGTKFKVTGDQTKTNGANLTLKVGEQSVKTVTAGEKATTYEFTLESTMLDGETPTQFTINEVAGDSVVINGVTYTVTGATTTPFEIPVSASVDINGTYALVQKDGTKPVVPADLDSTDDADQLITITTTNVNGKLVTKTDKALTTTDAYTNAAGAYILVPVVELNVPAAITLDATLTIDGSEVSTNVATGSDSAAYYAENAVLTLIPATPADQTKSYRILKDQPAAGTVVGTKLASSSALITYKVVKEKDTATLSLETGIDTLELDSTAPSWSTSKFTIEATNFKVNGTTVSAGEVTLSGSGDVTPETNAGESKEVTVTLTAGTGYFVSADTLKTVTGTWSVENTSGGKNYNVSVKNNSLKIDAAAGTIEFVLIVATVDQP